MFNFSVLWSVPITLIAFLSFVQAIMAHRLAGMLPDDDSLPVEKQVRSVFRSWFWTAWVSVLVGLLAILTAMAFIQSSEVVPWIAKLTFGVLLISMPIVFGFELRIYQRHLKVSPPLTK